MIGGFPDYSRILHNQDLQRDPNSGQSNGGGDLYRGGLSDPVGDPSQALKQGGVGSGSFSGGIGAGGGGGGGGGGVIGSPIHDVENPYCPSPTHHHQPTSYGPSPSPSPSPGPSSSRGNSPLPLSPTPVLQADDLCVVYPSSQASHLALKGVTFALRPGEKVALMGMNGGGKSTLFKALALGETTPCDGNSS